jgi:hypothetical protein
VVIEKLLLLGVGALAVLVVAPVIGAVVSPELGKSISDSGRDLIKGGLKFGLEASESWNDLVAQAKSKVKTKKASEQPPRGVEIARKANVSLLFEDLQRLSPLLVLRLFLSLSAYSPWLIYILFTSWQQMQSWRQIQTCQALIAQHRLAFIGVDETTLTVEWQSGGVSNLNQIWCCRKSSGAAVT